MEICITGYIVLFLFFNVFFSRVSYFGCPGSVKCLHLSLNISDHLVHRSGRRWDRTGRGAGGI